MVQNILWKCIAVFGWLFFAFSGVEAANADDSSPLPERCPVEIGGQVFYVVSVKMWGGIGQNRESWNPAQICAFRNAPQLEKVIIAQWAQPPDPAKHKPITDPFGITLVYCDASCAADYRGLVTYATDKVAKGEVDRDGFVDYLSSREDYKPSPFGRWSSYLHVHADRKAQNGVNFLVSCGSSPQDEKHSIANNFFCDLYMLHRNVVLVDVMFRAKNFERPAWIKLFMRVSQLISEMSPNHLSR